MLQNSVFEYLLALIFAVNPIKTIPTPSENGIHSVELLLDCCYYAGEAEYEWYQTYTIPDAAKYIDSNVTDCCFPYTFTSTHHIGSNNSWFTYSCSNATNQTYAVIGNDGTSTFSPDEETFCGADKIRDYYSIPDGVDINSSYMSMSFGMINGSLWTRCICNTMYQQFELGGASFVCSNDTTADLCPIPEDITGYLSVVSGVNSNETDTNGCNCSFNYNYLNWTLNQIDGYTIVNGEFYQYIDWNEAFINISTVPNYDANCVVVKVANCDGNNLCFYANGDGVSTELVDTAMSYFETGHYLSYLATQCYCYSMYDICVDVPTISTTKGSIVLSTLNTVSSTNGTENVSTLNTVTTNKGTESVVNEGYTFSVMFGFLCIIWTTLLFT